MTFCKTKNRAKARNCAEVNCSERSELNNIL